MVSSILKDVIGACGGVVMGACLLPQLWHMWKFQSAEDVDLIWAICYAVGLALTFTYLLLEQALIGWISAAAELTLALCLLALKLWLGRQYRLRNAPSLRRSGRQLSAGIAANSTVELSPGGVGNISIHVAGTDGGAAVAAAAAAAAATARGDAAGVTPIGVEPTPPIPSPAHLPSFLHSVSRRHLGQHVSLDCTPAAGSTVDEWRTFGIWLLDTLSTGTQAVGGSVRFQHLELLPPRLQHDPPDLSYQPGFSAVMVTGDGHIVSEFFAASGHMTVDMLVVGSQAVAQVQQLASHLQRQLAGRSTSPRQVIAERVTDRLLKEE